MITGLVTWVIGDLHVGGGQRDPTEDHVCQGGELIRFLAALPAETRVPIELVINGDFLDFAQVAPHVYTLGSTNHWCSEDESLEKLEVIIEGHRDIFRAIKDFQGADRVVSIAPGNHDVDLYWPAVQTRLSQVAGNVRFETGLEMLQRYGGKLLIGHGHAYDPANRFKNWVVPIEDGPDGKRRLEMCPGTLFIVKFINGLEAQYPFVDNIKPISQLARFLVKKGPARWLPVAWSILRFAARHPLTTLGRKTKLPDVAGLIRQTFDLDGAFRTQIVELYRKACGGPSTEESVARVIHSDEELSGFLIALALRLPPEEWGPAFDAIAPRTLSAGQRRGTLSIARAGLKNEKEILREEAKTLLSTGAQVVVFGHTHQPDAWKRSGKAYFNPGSWTRYVDLDLLETQITMDDLRNEENFPYQLNYVWVEETSAGIRGELRCFERKEGKWASS